MTACSNAVENLGISALTRETGNVKPEQASKRPAGENEKRMNGNIVNRYAIKEKRR